ncbi:hypothetical protein MSPP1_003726 [Malassezia sp. CBS 17886]|nr:hypothetical protein MSPP1_003726 [Malassezia sp. CBS 17886]
MSALFDLLSYGTPVSRRLNETSPRRHRSLSPSPGGRVAWRDSQPSSSPHAAVGVVDVSEALGRPALPRALPADPLREGTPPPLLGADQPASPSRARALRERRRQRRVAAHMPYAYSMFPEPTAHRVLDAFSFAERPSDPPLDPPRDAAMDLGADPPSDAFLWPSSDSLPSPPSHRAATEPPAQGSDDSFSRLDEVFALDVGEMEKMARCQGW